MRGRWGVHVNFIISIFPGLQLYQIQQRLQPNARARASNNYRNCKILKQTNNVPTSPEPKNKELNINAIQYYELTIIVIDDR